MAIAPRPSPIILIPLVTLVSDPPWRAHRDPLACKFQRGWRTSAWMSPLHPNSHWGGFVHPSPWVWVTAALHSTQSALTVPFALLFILAGSLAKAMPSVRSPGKTMLNSDRNIFRQDYAPLCLVGSSLLDLRGAVVGPFAHQVHVSPQQFSSFNG